MSTPTVAESLRLANGIAPEEFDRVVTLMGRLDERLRSFRNNRNLRETL